MRFVQVVLTTPAGDELCRTPIPDIQVAGVGETDGAVRPRLSADMAVLHGKIDDAVASEGMTLALDGIDCQIAVSRALLSAGDQDDDILIRLPVRALPGNPKDAPSSSTPATEATGTLDELFDLTELNIGGPSHA